MQTSNKNVSRILIGHTVKVKFLEVNRSKIGARILLLAITLEVEDGYFFVWILKKRHFLNSLLEINLH